MANKATNLMCWNGCQNGHYKNVRFGINSVFMGCLMSLKPPQIAIHHNLSSTFITFLFLLHSKEPLY